MAPTIAGTNAKADDFIGVQNYERALWGDKGRLPAPSGATVNWSGSEVWGPSLGGAVRVNGQPVSIKHPQDAIRAGLALVPEDRKAQGAILNLTIRDNVAMVGMNRWQRAGFVKDRQIDQRAEEARLKKIADDKKKLAAEEKKRREQLRCKAGGFDTKLIHVRAWQEAKGSLFCCCNAKTPPKRECQRTGGKYK